MKLCYISAKIEVRGCVRGAAGGNCSSRCHPTRRKLPHGWTLHRPQNVLCFSYALTCLLLLSFSSVWYDVDGCGEIPTAYNVVCFSHGSILFYWVFLPVNYYEDDSFLSCTVWLIIMLAKVEIWWLKYRQGRVTQLEHMRFYFRTS